MHLLISQLECCYSDRIVSCRGILCLVPVGPKEAPHLTKFYDLGSGGGVCDYITLHADKSNIVQ